MCNPGRAYESHGQHAKSIEHGTQALAIMREIGNRAIEASILSDLGIAYYSIGQFVKAVVSAWYVPFWHWSQVDMPELGATHPSGHR